MGLSRFHVGDLVKELNLDKCGFVEKIEEDIIFFEPVTIEKIKHKIIKHIEYDDELSLYNIPNGISSKWKKTFNNLIKKTDKKVTKPLYLHAQLLVDSCQSWL